LDGSPSTGVARRTRWGTGQRSAKLVPEREHPPEEAESRSLAPAVLLALARDRTASLLSVADQRSSDIERCKKQQTAPEHAALSRPDRCTPGALHDSLPRHSVATRREQARARDRPPARPPPPSARARRAHPAARAGRRFPKALITREPGPPNPCTADRRFPADRRECLGRYLVRWRSCRAAAGQGPAPRHRRASTISLSVPCLNP
jgi:hypothetical protein